MSDIQKPDRVDRPRDEGIFVPPIERDRKEKEPFREQTSERTRRILFASLFTYLKNLFDSFSTREKIEGQVIDHTAILEDLRIFKRLLQTLANEDHSNDPIFANQLSELWHKIREDFNNIQILERKNLKNILTFRDLIEAIKHYPPKQDHSFGYYLTEHAGATWLPFPYIEILKNLHMEYQGKKENSILGTWISSLRILIEGLEGKIKP